MSTDARVGKERFGTLADGRTVDLFTLAGGGLRARVITYGAALVSLEAPDRGGRLDDVVLGFDGLHEYVDDSMFVGAFIGRYANRIAGARFTLDGRTYVLPANDGPNHLHGGPVGFHKALWAGEPLEREGAAGVRLRLVSPDGDAGYPGRLSVQVDYVLGPGSRLAIEAAATTDAPTPVSLTQHSYFNLQGAGQGDVLGHVLTLEADAFTPVDEQLIPDGSQAPVAGTPFDFRTPMALGARINAPHEQLRRGGGYDHNFVLRGGAEPLAHAARVSEPRTGRTLDLWTTAPGLQLYSGNFLDGRPGKGGRRYERRGGLCLEPQHFPDSPNQPRFPSAILRPGARHLWRTVLALGIA